MPAEARIYAVVPLGLNGMGGIASMAAYYVKDWQARRRRPEVHVLDSYGPHGFWVMPFYFAATFATILFDGLRGRIALLHVHMAEDASTVRKCLLLLLGKALGIPGVIHMHGARFAQSYERLPPFAARLLARVMSRADLVLVLGGASRWFLVDRLGLAPDRIVVMANAVPDPGLRPTPSADGPCRLMFLGELGPRKGLDVLLAALASPVMAAGNWHADIAGNGDLAVWGAEAERLGIASRVTWHGWLPRERGQAVLAQAGLLVLPSRHEGLPMAILEAMAAGIPVVATPVGDITDAVEDGVSGLVVPAGSAPELAAALARLIGDAALRERMGQAGRVRYERDYAIAAYGNRLEALLNRAARRVRQPA